MKRLVIQGIVTLLLLGGIAWSVDQQAFIDSLGKIRATTWLLVLLLLFLQNDLAVTRWTLIIRAFGPPPSHPLLLKMHYMGQFAQLFLISSIGNAAVRAWALTRSGFGIGPSINSVVLDRAIAMLGLLILTALFLPWIGAFLMSGSDLRTLGRYAIILLAIPAIAGLVLVFWPIRFWVGLLKRTYLRVLIEPLEGARGQLRRWQFITPPLIVSLVAQAVTMITVFVLAQGTGIQVNLVDCLLIMPPVMVLSALPITIGGWGVREGSMIVAFGVLGVPREDALVLAIQFGLMGYLAALPGAVAWFREADRSFLLRSSSTNSA